MIPDGKAVRPRDAAGLVLLRDGRAGREVLLGRRRQSARFLPGVYVFPGGRLDPEDRLNSGFAERFQALPGGLDAATQRKAAALLRAAFRETFEETGVLVGRPGRPQAPGKGPVWQAYGEAALEPAFDAARLLLRAITPTFSRIRFHTRFFLIEATGIEQGTPRDDELEDVAWVPLAEAGRLPMVDVTEYVLREAQQAPRSTATLFTYRNDQLRADLRRKLPPGFGQGPVGSP